MSAPTVTTPPISRDSTLLQDVLTAAAAVLGAAALMAALAFWTGTVSGVWFIVAVAALAWQRGLRRGLVASVFATGAQWLLMARFDVGDRALARTLILLLACVVVSWLCGNLYASRRQLQREQLRLKESEQFHRVIGELCADFAFHARFSSDTEIEIDAFTPGLSVLSGYELADLQRQSWMNRIHPDDQPLLQQAIARTRRGESVTDHARIRTRDGRWVFVEFRVHPERDEQGTIVGLVGAVRDVTQARKQADALEREQRRFEAATNALSGLIYEWDVVTGEARRFGGIEGITGFPDHEAENSAEWWMQRVYPEDAPRVAAEWADTLARKATRRDATYRMVRRDGQVRHLWDSGHITYDNEGRCLRCTGYVVDVTERVMAENALRLARDRAETHAQEMEEARAALNDRERLLREESQRKDEFLATLSHELRNPLAPLRNATAIVAADAALSETSRQASEVMSRQLQHMVRLVDDLLDVSRITRGHLELRREVVDLRAVVESACDDARPQLEENGVALTVAAANGPFPVHADPARMSQVVANLLSNAAKFTPRGGHVTVTVRSSPAAPQDVTLSVKDTGIGIDPSERDRIFDMFVQLNRETRLAQTGLGIGLAMVKRIAEMHGGFVSVASDGIGHGTEVAITIPLASPAALGADPIPEAVATVPKRRILVADDSRDGADSLAFLLRASGHEVCIAYDGQAAVQAVETFQPDLALLDLGMPGVSGYDAARAIRRQPWGRGVRLVALTGWGQDDHRRRSHDAGFDDHLVKPLELETLERLLASWWARSKSGTRITPVADRAATQPPSR